MTTMLESVRELQPTIRSEVREMQAGRRLTATVVDGMHASGVFGMALPRSLGGPELSPLEQFGVIEALTYADGSAGWDSVFALLVADASVAKTHVVPHSHRNSVPLGARLSGRPINGPTVFI